MRSKLHFVLILIFGFLSFSFGQETSFPKPIGYVIDFENVLSLEDRSNNILVTKRLTLTYSFMIHLKIKYAFL